jgi:hypothetical protein
MVAAFLRAEIDGDRWSSWIVQGLAAHGWPESLIRTPDLTDAAANAHRSWLLNVYRGWARDDLLFRGLPPDVAWHDAELDRADVAAALGANVEPWIALSSGSRRFGDMAAAVRAGGLTGDPADTADRASRIADRYRAREDLERPILVARSEADVPIGVEGHTRLVGWLLADRTEPLPIIVGLSPKISAWLWA